MHSAPCLLLTLPVWAGSAHAASGWMVSFIQPLVLLASSGPPSASCSSLSTCHSVSLTHWPEASTSHVVEDLLTLAVLLMHQHWGWSQVPSVIPSYRSPSASISSRFSNSKSYSFLSSVGVLKMYVVGLLPLMARTNSLLPYWWSYDPPHWSRPFRKHPASFYTLHCSFFMVNLFMEEHQNRILATLSPPHVADIIAPTKCVWSQLLLRMWLDHWLLHEFLGVCWNRDLQMIRLGYKISVRSQIPQTLGTAQSPSSTGVCEVPIQDQIRLKLSLPQHCGICYPRDFHCPGHLSVRITEVANMTSVLGQLLKICFGILSIMFRKLFHTLILWHLARWKFK